MSQDTADKMQPTQLNKWIPVYAIYSLHLFDSGGAAAAEF